METPVTRESVLDYAESRYGALPEYLWAQYPTYAVLRRPDGPKWFAVVMDVPREKLGLPGGGTVEILDLKCDPRMTGSLLESPGFLPAYHMNKTNWVTVLLDGTVPLEEIKGLLELSYDLAGPAQNKKRHNEE